MSIDEKDKNAEIFRFRKVQIYENLRKYEPFGGLSSESIRVHNKINLWFKSAMSVVERIDTHVIEE